MAGEFCQYCGKLLADLGADVIKVEPPGGDPVRRLGPFLDDDPDPEKSLPFLYFNANKRSVTLDLASAAGRRQLRRLVSSADILIEGCPPGYLESLGLGYRELSAAKPDLIVTSITGFGQWGPHAGYKYADIVGFAMSGAMFLAGFPDAPPYRPYDHHATLLASLQGALGTLLALHHRDVTGEGQHVDVSMQEALSLTQEIAMQAWDMRRELLRRRGLRSIMPVIGHYQCADGYIYSMSGVPGFGAPWPEVIRWLAEHGMAGELATPEWAAFLDRLEMRELTVLDADPEVARRLAVVQEVLAAFYRSKTKRELFQEGQKRRIIIGPVNSPGDLGQDPHLGARRWWQELNHPELGRRLRYPGPPYRLPAGGWRLRRQAPSLGEHTQETLSEKPPPVAARQTPPAGGAAADSPRRPLEGVRVADFSWFGAGPIAAKFLAHFGAQVVRVESETRPDGLRLTYPTAPGKAGLNVSGYYNNFNADKLGLALDMRQPGALSVALRLIARCDVVMENYTPRVFESWGLTYEAMRRVKPDIIYARLPAFGTTGPYRGFLGFGAVIGPSAGIDYLSGHPDREPVGLGTNYSDFVLNPSHAVIAILAALRHRDRTGEGQLVEVAQLESVAATLGPALLDYTVNSRVQGRTGNRDPLAAPHGAYPCRREPEAPEGADRWCVIAVTTEEEWTAFCRVLGDPEWARDPRFATLAGRKEHEDELDRQVGAWTAGHYAWEVMELLQRAGVPAGVVHTAADVLERDPHLKARGYYVYLDHPEAGRTAYDGLAIRLSRTPGEVRSPAPCLGEHTWQVCTEILGMNPEEVARLTAEGVLR